MGSVSTGCIRLACTRRGGQGECRFLEQVKMLRTLLLACMMVVIAKSFVFIPRSIFGTRRKPLNTELMSKRGLCVPSLVFPSQTTCSSSFALSSPGGSNPQRQHSVGFGQTGSGYISCEI